MLQPCMVTKLPIKHYKTHTTAQIHGETMLEATKSLFQCAL